MWVCTTTMLEACLCWCGQVHTLLKGLEKIAASADIPMLVAGDFNSTPGSAAHALLVKRAVDPSHPVRPCNGFPSLQTARCSPVHSTGVHQDNSVRRSSSACGVWLAKATLG